MIRDAMPLLGTNSRERRREERVELILPGRYMLRDRYEYPCSTIDISPGGVGIRGLAQGHIGEPIIIYINDIGRIEGVVARHFDECFAVRVKAPALKRERLAGKIAQLVKHLTLCAPDQRRHERVVPDNPQTTLRTPDGDEYFGTLINVSYPGAALSVDAVPPVGSLVTIGHASAHVVRHFAGGVAVAFDDPLSAEHLCEFAKAV